MSAQRKRDYEDEPDFDDDKIEREVMDPDRPLESEDSVTVREQLLGDTINTRHAREEPEEPIDVGDDRVGHLVEETDRGRDVTKELEADETDDDEDLSPEERAMHHTEEAR